MIYTATIGLSALLLFLVQPYVSKMLLPMFGGGASIWVTSMVFFQIGLLIGYGATHLVIRRFGIRIHLRFLLGMVLLSIVFLPISVSGMSAQWLPPSATLFLTLAVSVGVPYFILASTSPTLQYCIASDQSQQNANPYVQYGVSNLGSLAGLLIFPFLLEPSLRHSQIAGLWSAFYVVYALLITGVAYVYLKANHTNPETNTRVETQGSTLSARWLFLAAVPSALLVVTTHYLTLDIANLPLLWVAPLSLYLLTFIICFLFPAVSRPTTLRVLVGLAGVALLVSSKWAFLLETKVGLSLLGLFFVCMIFHGDLERAKPPKLALTGYYLQVAAGGCLGSILAAIVAPVIFDSLFEFRVVALVAVYYVIANGMRISNALTWLLRGALLTSLTISYLVNESTLTGETVERSRSFYSTYAVREADGMRRLVVGTHIHGSQYMDPERKHIPTDYYHDGTAVSHVFDMLKPETVGIVGLGIGSMVEYGNAGMQIDLYELDPEAIRLAWESFTILEDSSADLNIIKGDGRQRWREKDANTYDVMFLDAFSSGTIPTHLITVEAMMKLRHIVKDDGLIAYHVSNQHIDLIPVLYGIAEQLDLGIISHLAESDIDNDRFPAAWVLISGNHALLAEFQQKYHGWQNPPANRLVWTDDFSNIWSVLR
ncbi:MAG: fused MFS/spermidine synthase [Proteobacteria bacterium]|nr:fused MFS/spermidine synthase [Pseudomonadota bacterium]